MGVEFQVTAPEMAYTDDGGEVDEGLALGTIFTVSRKSCLASYSLMIVHRLTRIPHTTGPQEPPRPPAPEPTLAVYENITGPEDNHHHIVIMITIRI